MAIKLFGEELYAICRLPDRPNPYFLTFAQFLPETQDLSLTDC